MSNKILIKSGDGAPANGVLDTAELGFDKTNNKLYIGNNGSVIDLIGTDWFEKGVAIPANSDLNNYNTPGKYNVSSTSTSKTILNSPVTNDNFVLFVFARTTSNSTSLTQMIISLGSSLYIRNNNSSGEWRDWVRYARASEAITNLSASGETITYTKGDGTTGTVTTSTSSAAVADKLVNIWVTGSILDFALSCSVGLTNFVTSGETTDLPTSFNTYGYGTGFVMKRSDTFIYVELHPYNVKNSPIARNSYNNGTWYGWTYDYSEAYKPTASDVGAAPAGHTHTAAQVGALPVNGNAATASRVLVHNCSNTDFNTLTEAGLYQGYTGMTNANWPNSISVLEVIPYSYDWIVQRQTLINGDGQTAIRFKHSGTTWSPWKVMLPTSGGTMSGYLDMNYNNITTLGWPEGDRDATPRKYVDDVVSGKLSLSGGTLTGDLSINNSINLSSSSQGGNIQIIPPSAYGVNYWEADAYNGNLRIFAQRNDSSYTFPLTLRSDGGIEISNAGCYGTSLPSAGTKGRIFFKKVSS